MLAVSRRMLTVRRIAPPQRSFSAVSQVRSTVNCTSGNNTGVELVRIGSSITFVPDVAKPIETSATIAMSADTQGESLCTTMPLSLGIETLGGVFTRIVPMNTPIPSKYSQTFSTSTTTTTDNQTHVNIKVFQGEHETAVDNQMMAQFDLVGISSAPSGVLPQIEIIFDVEANGICSVTAENKTTGETQSVMIATAAANLTQPYYSRMRRDILGIDLGTTYSCAAIAEDDKLSVIENAEGFRTTPSYVAFEEGNQHKLVGLAAKRQAIINPQSTFFSAKRLIGRRFDDPHIQTDLKNLPFKTTSSPSGDVWVEDANGKQFSPSHISAFILEKMKETAETHLGRKVTDAVLTCPAYFNDSQRRAMKDAGEMAGLKVLRVINEPTAAALAFGVDKINKSTIAVYNFGGGTFDISVLEVDEGVFEVKAMNGDAHLGGEDFDLLMSDHIIKQFKSSTGIDLGTDRRALQRVREEAEKAKCELSSSMQTEVNLLLSTTTASDTNGVTSQHATCKIVVTRTEWEAICADLIQRSLKPCEQCLKDSGIEAKDLSDVLLIGGMTRMPKIVETVKHFFGREPSCSVNPDEAVAVGAAYQGSVLCGQVGDFVLFEANPS